MLYTKHIILVCGICSILFSCKKENNEPTLPSAPTEQSDFTLQASDVNYTIGTTWVYSVFTQNTTTTLNNSIPPVIQSSNSTYTVKVVYDSLMANNITGKVLQTFIDGFNGNGTLKELQYIDPVTNIWHQILFGSVNNNSITPEGFGIQLPLTFNSNWTNPYYLNPSSTIDSCYATGFENLSIAPGYLKCIRWKNKDLENPRNIYWYNKMMGRVKIETKKTDFPNLNTLVVVSNTTTLTKFN